jgi:hypothetical protein
MQNPFKPLLDKVFTHPITRESYGPIRLSDPDTGSIRLNGAPSVALAEDSCGNYFATTGDGALWFWDHETDDVVLLADSMEDFMRHCSVPPSIELDPGQVKSAWVDPEFARKCGLAAPSDGWIQRPTKRNERARKRCTASGRLESKL